MADRTSTPEDSSEYGVSLREKVPLEDHADWSPGSERKDPVALIEEQNEDRLSWLVPVRRFRMARSAFAFFRGSARIMAWDLAPTPVSGLQAQLCGDAHLANFGAYASPERRLVFDINDFDETLPGPWEWDVKRLAASLFIAGRHNGLDDSESRRVTRRSVAAYRKAIATLAGMRLTDVWYTLFETEDLVKSISNPKERKAADRLIKKAKRKDSRHALDRLTEFVDGRDRIRSEPPLLIPLRDIVDKSKKDDVEERILNSLEEYHQNCPDDVEFLLRKFRPVDFAIKVVGVGSVGTMCSIVLFEGRNRDDPLLLQIKQAGTSVLEEHLPASRYENSGERVVQGQRLMQTANDIFLGWTTGDVSGNHFYCRQLKDWKSSADVENATYSKLMSLGRHRGWALARCHARAGDPNAISGYLGAGKTFDRAITEFAARYADQNDEDYKAFVAEIQNGQLEGFEFADGRN